MIQQVKWTDIRFNFDFPAGKFPAIVERISGTPSRIEEKIKDIPYMLLDQQHNGGWSIQEHVGHLIDLELLHDKRLGEFETGIETLSPADMSNLRTDEAGYNEQNISDILKEFRKVRNAFVKRVLAYDDTMPERTALHPRLQTPMRLVDMLYFVAEHDDHHMAIISRIHRELA